MPYIKSYNTYKTVFDMPDKGYQLFNNKEFRLLLLDYKQRRYFYTERIYSRTTASGNFRADKALDYTWISTKNYAFDLFILGPTSEIADYGIRREVTILFSILSRLELIAVFGTGYRPFIDIPNY